jgi:hypothetical protein
MVPIIAGSPSEIRTGAKVFRLSRSSQEPLAVTQMASSSGMRADRLPPDPHTRPAWTTS